MIRILACLTLVFSNALMGDSCKVSPLTASNSEPWPSPNPDYFYISPAMSTPLYGMVRNGTCTRIVGAYNQTCSVNVHPGVSWSCSTGTLSGGMNVQSTLNGVWGNMYVYRSSPNLVSVGIDVWEACYGDWMDGDLIGFTDC
jgi:hypothetical protein